MSAPLKQPARWREGSCRAPEPAILGTARLAKWGLAAALGFVGLGARAGIFALAELQR
jgi:hypothetical protein